MCNLHTRGCVMKMPLRILLFGLIGISCVPSYAITYDLDVAINNVRNACSGINSKMDHLKLMAGINTGIGAVGTVTGAVALGTGIAKAETDAKLEKISKQIAEKLKTVPAGVVLANKQEFLADYERAWAEDKDQPVSSENKKYIEQKNKLEQESKTLGNVRTGMLAVNTATSIAGAVISSQNKTSGSIRESINNCIAATDALRESMMQARLENKDTTQAKRIVDACAEYKFADLSKIDKLATGSTITSSVGAVAGGIGTITSIAANTDATRNDNSKDGREKEKSLNTAANVFSGVTTATSAMSTVLNGVQIAAIKKVVSVSESCEKELQ